MRTASIRDLHVRTSELVAEASDPETVAELRPREQEPTRRPGRDMTEFWARMPKVTGDSGRFLEQDRDRDFDI